MPPKAKVTKEAIITAALDLVREFGPDGLNARAVAAKLGTSTQPIFSHYDTMDALREDVIRSANATYQIFLHQEMSSGKYPMYKASGMGYIGFAREEPQLFKLLFMRDRSGEVIPTDSAEIAPLIELIHKSTGMSREDAKWFHLEMWIYVHGIATMLATNYLPLSLDDISNSLTDVYQGLKDRYTRKEGVK